MAKETADMTEMELVERIKLEEDTLCALPFEPRYKARRTELTNLVNLHRSMLVDIVGLQEGCSGRGETDMGSQAPSPARPESSDHAHCASPNSVTERERPRDVVRVLVVESEPIVSLLLRLVLENRGYSVREVERRAEAVTESGVWAPDVIVTDLPLRHTASVQFVAELTAEAAFRAVTVIGTGPSMLHVPGIDAFFVKPFEAEEIAETIASLIGDRSGDPAARMSVTEALDTCREVLCDGSRVG